MLQTADETRTPENLSRLALRIAERGQITPRDVLAMRQGLYADGVIRRVEAETLFALEHAIVKRHPAWDELYVEALTDYFREGRDDFSLTDEDVAFLKKGILANGAIADPTELRLLLNILFQARSCPEELHDFTRAAVAHSVRTSNTAMYGEGARTAGAVDRHDVEAIRRLVYGHAGKDGMRISECEACWLIEIDHATDGAANDTAWRDLFIKAVAMHLLLAGPSPDCIDVAKVEWLERNLLAGGTLTANGEALLSYLRAEAANIHDTFNHLHSVRVPAQPPA